MGLFSSQRRVHVATAISRVISEAAMPDIVREAVPRAIFGSDDIPGEVLDGIIHGFGLKAERAYRSAKNNDYVLGVPNHTARGQLQGLDEFKNYLQALYPGESVVVDSYAYRGLDMFHIAWNTLEQIHGYNRYTNRILTQTVPEAHTDAAVYVEHIQALINIAVPNQAEPVEPALPSADDMLMAEQPARERFTPWDNPDAFAKDFWFTRTDVSHCNATVAWRSDTPTPGSPTALNLAAYATARAALLAQVQQLEAAANALDYEADPLAYESAQANAAQLRISYELALSPEPAQTFVEDYPILRKTIRLDLITGFDPAIDTIQAVYRHGTEDGKGGAQKRFTYVPGAGSLTALNGIEDLSNDQGSFMPFVILRAEGQNLADGGYLGTEGHASSVKLCKTLGIDYEALLEAVEENPDIDKLEQVAMLFGIPIDTTDETGLEYLARFFEWVHLADPNRGIGYGRRGDGQAERAIQFADGGFNMTLRHAGTEVETRAGQLGNGRIGTCVRTESIINLAYDVRFTNLDFSVETRTVLREKKLLQFELQVGPAEIRTIRIAAPALFYRVEGKWVEVDLDDKADATDPEVFSGAGSRLLLPLNHEIVRDHFNILERDRLYAQSLHLVYNSVVVQKIKWYETETFAFFLIFVALVITVVSLGTAAPALTATYASLAAVYGAYAAAVLVALQVIALNLLVNAVFSFIAEEIGAEAALVLAIAAASIGFYGSSTGTLTAGTTQALLFSANGLANAGVKVSEEELADVVDAISSDAEAQQAQLLELDELREQLGFNDPISDQLAAQRVTEILLEDTPEDFYRRRAHNANPGVALYALQRTHVSRALELPTQVLTGRPVTPGRAADDPFSA